MNVSALATESTLEILRETIFCHTDRDNQLAPSVEYMMFLQKMAEAFSKDNTNSWVAPMPFRIPRRFLLNYRDNAHRRLLSLWCILDKKGDIRPQFLKFMQKMLHNNHAELAPLIKEEKE